MICVGLAFLGVFLPGLPTTIFLIAASFLFARSFPALEERVFRIRAFKPFLPYVRGEEELTPRARVAAIVAMWTAVTLSLVGLHSGGKLLPWLGLLIAGAALAGTFFIWRFRRGGA